MLTKSILAAALIAASVPAFANPGAEQLALQPGVEPGVSSPPQLALLDQAMRDDDQQAVDFILNGGNIVTRGSGSVAVSTSSGATQLAMQVGVEPGTMSVNELASLQDAVREQDSTTVEFILSGQNRAVTDDPGAVKPVKAHLAASLGVDPAASTTAELARLFSDRWN